MKKKIIISIIIMLLLALTLSGCTTTRYSPPPSGPTEHMVECFLCMGTGISMDDVCPECDGKGWRIVYR